MGTSGEGGGGTGRECEGEVSEDASCWTTNEYGVFVSGDAGDDTTGDGTKEKPYQTLSKGISAAGGKNVYVCERAHEICGASDQDDCGTRRVVALSSDTFDGFQKGSAS
jgi:hypothetical protein